MYDQYNHKQISHKGYGKHFKASRASSSHCACEAVLSPLSWPLFLRLHDLADSVQNPEDFFLCYHHATFTVFCVHSSTARDTNIVFAGINPVYSATTPFPILISYNATDECRQAMHLNFLLISKTRFDNAVVVFINQQTAQNPLLLV